MTTKLLSAAITQRLELLSICDKAQMCDWCQAVLDVSTYFANMPRTDQEVRDFGDDTFSELAGEMLEMLIGQLQDAVPETDAEAKALARVLVP